MVDPENIRELILNKLMIERINRENYYRNFVCFINMQNSVSKFTEKIEACRIFCQISGLEDKYTWMLIAVELLYLSDVLLLEERKVRLHRYNSDASWQHYHPGSSLSRVASVILPHDR